MFSALGKWVRGSRNDKDFVTKYTADLSQITSQIHHLDVALKKSQSILSQWQSNLTFYGIAFTVLALSYTYWEYHGYRPYLVVTALLCIGSLILFKWALTKLYAFYNNNRLRKLAKLRAIHQKKLEKLKEETHYNATSSIIQRFSSGEDQNDDAMVLLDDELNAKYQELNNLKTELEKFKKESHVKGLKKEDSDAWFDKIISVLAGGNELDSTSSLSPFKKIICPQCHWKSNCYRLASKPIIFICPHCNHKIDEVKEREDAIEAKQPAQPSQSEKEKTK
ncbi:BEM_collapsed_G0026600.mRNA.1.CDS.1 [Saccharomyces cerevisiae]|nr:BEM_HP_G0049790.mRNA.1.CDS.1 [Saccharomyces cerevisiae]CAI6960468.1 BEM_HP_G0049790.mRNA.1.CDS.1 [Saccharomyces cerevisiae]CAI7169995.1 BEM_collapsed_G0026600.mRNA.1.CDS.1 [Saccharomyces cerevisiae]